MNATLDRVGPFKPKMTPHMLASSGDPLSDILIVDLGPPALTQRDPFAFAAFRTESHHASINYGGAGPCACSQLLYRLELRI